MAFLTLATDVALLMLLLTELAAKRAMKIAICILGFIFSCFLRVCVCLKCERVERFLYFF